MVVLLALSVTSWLGLTPRPVAQNAAIRLQAPSTHLFGTDLFGRDIFSRSVAGLANSVRVAVLAVAAAAFVGVLAGLLGGYFRGVTDAVSGGIANILFAFPPLLLALTLASVLQRTWVTVALAIAVVYVPIFYRVTRGPASLREREFVKAAVSQARRPRPPCATCCPTCPAWSWCRSPSPVVGRADRGGPVVLGSGTPPPRRRWGR
jgi:peptide/nickel transport system permease protein